MTRPWTEDRVDADGTRTITMKRACNGCGHLLGDITQQEMNAGIAGAPLPDVRRECPTCGPTAPEPACRPMQVVAGDVLCLELECDHEHAAGEYCDEVAEEFVCGTHSEIGNGGRVGHAEPWPCKHTKVAAS